MATGDAYSEWAASAYSEWGVTVAWNAYSNARKPARKAGAGFSAPNYDLSLEGLAIEAVIEEAHTRHHERAKPKAHRTLNAAQANQRRTRAWTIRAIRLS